VAKSRRFKTRTGVRQPSVKALEALLEQMSSRESIDSARAKIRLSIETGDEIDLTDDERAEVVAEIRQAMQHGQIDAEIAGIRHDESA
jgi:cytidylate kinase